MVALAHLQHEPQPTPYRASGERETLRDEQERDREWLREQDERGERDYRDES